MNLTPEQLRELSLRVRDEMSVKGFRWIPDNEAVLTVERLFAEFQKLQDSRIAELEEALAESKDESDERGLDIELFVAALNALEEQQPIAYLAEWCGGFETVHPSHRLGFPVFAAPITHP